MRETRICEDCGCQYVYDGHPSQRKLGAANDN